VVSSPPVLVLTGIVTVQVGAGLADRLFSQIPPAAVTGLRLWTAAILMAAFGARGLARSVAGLVRRRSAGGWQDAAIALSFGISLAVMNFSIYQAFARIPLGIAVTIEFLGPLGVAVASSRRPLDLLWVALAGAGVALLTRAGPAAAGAAARGGSGIAVTGVLFAVTAAAGWAAYIAASAATGRRFEGSSGLAIAMVFSAVLVTPPAVTAGGAALLRPGVVADGVAIGLLSSIIPYRLELEALRRIPARVFGIWMSLEPAVAALVGLVMLGQALAVREWVAVGCVMTACAGAARRSGRQAAQA